MLVNFTSEVDADVLMMDEHAKLVLRAAGKDIGDTMPEHGVFTVEQLPEAIKSLERSISGDTSRPKDDDDEDEDDPEAAAKRKEVVILEQRAYPLLAMMRKAHEAQKPILWETGSGW